ncbi:sensor histidine kinase [Blautia sp. HCP3S3_H10_1]|uniref:sensor histidine kinase n=1 Tax=unclassified Blautia TaxID=2648079 RepID=UPI003F8FFD7B
MKKKKTSPVSIRIKYTRYVIPILLITFLSIGAIDTMFYFHSVRESSAHQEAAYTSSALASLESYFDQFTSDSNIFFYKNSTQNVLVNANKDDGQETQQLLLNDAPYYPSLSANYSDNIFFLTNSGKLISASSYSSKSVSGFSHTYTDELMRKSENYHGLPFLFKTPDNSDKLYMCRNIYQWTGKTATTGKNYLGTLIVEPKSFVFDKIFSLNNNVYQFVLIDSDNHIFRNTTELSVQNILNLIHSESLSAQNCKYTATPISTNINNLKLLLITNQSLVYKDARLFIILLLFPSILSLFAIITATSFISRSIANEFGYFMKKLNKTKAINKDAFIHMDSSIEFAELSNVYNQTLSRIHTLSEKIHEQEILTKNIEIESLQAQINPHFLYNTLNCISGLVDMDRKEECHHALNALADIERMSLKGDPFSTIEETFYYVKEYTYIQKLRFGDNLSILIDIPQSLYHYYIPKLIIQPLIENAVIHGTSKISGKGIIAILGSIKEAHFQICVKDNGPGFSQDFLDNFDDNSKQKPATSYGLYNIDKRLKLYYGEKHGLILSNNENNGACITIRLPLTLVEKPIEKAGI